MSVSTDTATDIGPRIVRNARPPGYRSTREWLGAGFARQRGATVGALAAAWTGLPFALWLAAAGVIVGALVGALGISVLGGVGGSFTSNQGVGAIGAVLGAVVGAGLGFALIYIYLFTHLLQLVGALASGAVVSIAVLTLMIVAEPWLMRLRGYREPSRREQALLNPILEDAGREMALSIVPALWISEQDKPGAWAHMRGIVVTRGLLGDYSATQAPPKPDLDRPALGAILAHELHHWEMGDVVATAMVAACFCPFVFIVNAIAWLRIRAEWAALLIWLFLWPVWVASRLVVALTARAARQAEFDADARAAGLGDEYRLGLRRALDELSMWERPRTGWEAVLAATHPPIEQRLERLEAPREPETLTATKHR